MNPMTTPAPAPLLTAEQLAADPRFESCELWDGIPVVKEPSGGYAPFLEFGLGGLLFAHLAAHDLGWGYSANGGFLLRRDPERVLSPALAFVSYDRLPERPKRGFAACVPELVVEVRSPDQTWREILEKGVIWASHGVRVAWLVDPVGHRAVTMRPDAPPVEVGEHGVLDAAPALPGFTVRLETLFRERRPPA